MATKAHNGTVRVHPSGLIEISGETDGERPRQLIIHLPKDEAAKLAEAFRLAEQMEDGHIGHAFWHASNPDRLFPCETCTLKDLFGPMEHEGE